MRVLAVRAIQNHTEMKIYTRTGDTGTTSLIGGTRVPKHSTRLETYGAVDELTAFVGQLHDHPDIAPTTKALLVEIMSRLMDCAAVYAADEATLKKIPHIADSSIAQLETEIDAIYAHIDPPRAFVLPCGHSAVSLCHVCRTVCRRTERLATKLASEIDLPPNTNKYINRLSDYLFALSQQLAEKLGVEQIKWQPNV